MSDPLRQALARRRAAKRGHRAEPEPTTPQPQLVAQGVRSQAPMQRRRVSADDLLRDAAWAARNRPPWVRID